MLKSYHYGAFLLGLTLSNNVIADCSWPEVANASSTLSGNTVCVGAVGAWEAQEQHHTNGELWDYKHGPTSLNDPTDIVGGWSASSTSSSVTYTYPFGGSTSYTYTLHHNALPSGNTDYTFCSTSTTVEATIKNGEVGC